MRALTVVVVALCVVPLFAQVQQSAVEGRVIDAEGLPIADANIELRDAATNQSWRAISDAAGAFRLSVPPSDYELHVERATFNSHSETGLHLVVGRSVQLTI